MKLIFDNFAEMFDRSYLSYYNNDDHMLNTNHPLEVSSNWTNWTFDEQEKCEDTLQLDVRRHELEFDVYQTIQFGLFHIQR